MHLEADGAGAGLALPGAARVLPKVTQVFAAYCLDGGMAGDFRRAAVVHKYLQVHFCLAAQLLNVRNELALV